MRRLAPNLQGREETPVAAKLDSLILMSQNRSPFQDIIVSQYSFHITDRFRAPAIAMFCLFIIFRISEEWKGLLRGRSAVWIEISFLGHFLGILDMPMSHIITGNPDPML